MPFTTAQIAAIKADIAANSDMNTQPMSNAGHAENERCTQPREPLTGQCEAATLHGDRMFGAPHVGTLIRVRISRTTGAASG